MPGLKGPPSGLTGNAQPRLVPNDELQQYQQHLNEAEIQRQQPFMDSLAAYVRARFDDAYNAKRTASSGDRSVEDEILRDYRQRDGTYDQEKLSQIRQQGGSEVFMELTSVKCRTAEAHLEEILLPAGDRPWGVEPAEEPELDPETQKRIEKQVGQETMEALRSQGQMPAPEEIRQRLQELDSELRQRHREKAEEIATKMGDRIEDQFDQGGFYDALRASLSDLVTTKAGIVKGPIPRKRKVMQHVQGENGWEPQVRETIKLEYVRVSPLDVYPSPQASGPQEGYLCERHKLERTDLNAMIGVEGYDSEAIKRVLADHYNTGDHSWLSIDRERADHEQKEHWWSGRSETITAIEFWGNINGKLLREWGMEDVEEHEEYQANVWLVGDEVIKAVLNQDPLGRRPYSVASFEHIPGAFWGRGLAEMIRDCQDVCNAAARALVNNMGIASGPQVAINDITRIPAGEDLTQVYPWKIWQFDADSINASGHRPPVEFFQPNAMTGELMQVFQFFSQLADDYTGIPAYIHGNEQTRGAGSTASGLSMLMDHTAKGLKRVVANVDRGQIRPIVQRQYDWNMIYLDDESIKGDLRVQARGSSALAEREQQSQRIAEFMQITANEYDMKLVGMKGRAQMLREMSKSLDIPVDELIKQDQEIEQMMAAEQEQPSLEQVEAQVKQKEAQIKEQETQLEAAETAAKLRKEKAETQKTRAEALKAQVETAQLAGGADEANETGQEVNENDGQELSGSARSQNAAGAPQSRQQSRLANGRGMATPESGARAGRERRNPRGT